MRRLSEQAREETRRRVVPSVAIDGAIGVIAVACELSHDEAVDAALDALDAVPRAQHDRGLEETQWLREEVENAWNAANIATMAREKAEAETARLREALASLVRAVERLDERPFAWEAPFLIDACRHARATLDAEDGGQDE